MESKQQKTVFLSLGLLLFIDSIGIGLIFPLMPELFLNPSEGLVTGHHYFTRDMLYGIAFSVFPMMSFFTRPGFGALSDTYGRRKLILLGAGGLAAGYGLSAFSVIVQNYQIFIFSRIVSGICAGTYVVAIAAISDISSGTRNKLKNFRWPILVTLTGFILGPGFSSLIGILPFPFGKLATPFIIAFLLSLINWLLLYVIFIETKTLKTKKTNIFNELKKCSGSFFYTLQEKRIRLHVIGYLLLYFGYGLFFQSISLYLAQFFGYSSSGIGFVFIIIGSLIAASTLLIQPFLYKIFEYKKLLYSSIFIMGFLLLCQGTGSIINKKEDFYTFWIVSIFYFILFPFASIGYKTLFSNIVREEEQGLIMGSMGQLNAFAFFISALMIGHLIRFHESLIFFLSGISMLISAVICTITVKKIKKIKKGRRHC